MARCVEKLPHRTDKCNSNNGLQVFLADDGTYNGFCFSCGTAVPHPYHDKPVGYKPQVFIKDAAQIEEELREIREDYGVHDLPDRKLKKEYLAYFGVKVGVSEQDGVTPISHYYPYFKGGILSGYKVRIIEGKKFYAIGSTKGVQPFGWAQALAAGGKKLFVCEGELDAVSLFQIMKEHNKGTQYADLNPAVISVSNGAGGAVKELSAILPEIRKTFKEIVLVFDGDGPGKKAAEDVAKVIPDAIIATLPSKDVNECLKDGRSKAAYNAVQFNAAKPKNTRLVQAGELHEQARIPPQYGVSWPWEHITKATRGIRLGETIYIGAGQKQG